MKFAGEFVIITLPLGVLIDQRLSNSKIFYHKNYFIYSQILISGLNSFETYWLSVETGSGRKEKRKVSNGDSQVLTEAVSKTARVDANS